MFQIAKTDLKSPLEIDWDHFERDNLLNRLISEKCNRINLIRASLIPDDHFKTRAIISLSDRKGVNSCNC